MGQGALAALIGVIVMATSSALATTTAGHDNRARRGSWRNVGGHGRRHRRLLVGHSGPPSDRCRDLVLHEGPTSGLSRAPECRKAEGS